MPLPAEEDLRSTDAILDQQAAAAERPPVVLHIPGAPRTADPADTDGPAPTDTEEEILTSIRYLWEPSEPELDAEPLPPPPMAVYNDEEFRFIMGAKRGPLVRMGFREDTKTQILQALADFNTHEGASERRRALAEVVTHASTYVRTNEKLARKSGRISYMKSLIASAEWEKDPSNLLSPRMDTSLWRVDPKAFSRGSGVLSGLLAADQNMGLVQDLLKQGEEREEALETASALGNTAGKVKSAAGQELFSGLKSLLESIGDNISLGSLAELATQYLAILEFVDVAGISNLLTSHAAFKDFKKTSRRIKALEPRRSSKDPFIQEFCEYGIAKLARRQFSNFYLGAMNFVRGISRIVSLLTGGTAALVTEAINQTAGIAAAVHEFARNAKGVYKWLVGTRSVARKTRAAMLIWRASLSASSVTGPLGASLRPPPRLGLPTSSVLPAARSQFERVLTALHGGTLPALPEPSAQPPATEAMQLFRDFLEPDFVVGLFIVKAIRKKVWDCLWSHGHEGMRVALEQSIRVVRSDTSTLDALKAALKESGPSRTRYLLAARVALGVQALVFNGLSSRPKYAGGSAMQNVQDNVIQGMLEGYVA